MNAILRTFAILATIFALSAESAVAKTVTDTYRFKMSLRVPRVYDNTQSLGYRKYQKQVIRGKLHITYDDEGEDPVTITFSELRNLSHRVNGSLVVYSAMTDPLVKTTVNVIGDNRTLVFNTASVRFGLVAEPSYALGEPKEDNSLYLVLAGDGKMGKHRGATVIRKMSGNVAGGIGCSCSAYGHMSPTRVMGYLGATLIVDDVAAVFGTWQAIRIVSESRK